MKKFKTCIVLFFGLLLFSCPSDDLNEDDSTTEPITYQLLNFIFTPQTDTVNDRVEYQVEFFNNNNFEVSGTPRITLNSDGIEFTSTPNADCQTIAANSSCVLSYDVEDNNPLIFPNSVEFVTAKYLLD